MNKLKKGKVDFAVFAKCLAFSEHQDNYYPDCQDSDDYADRDGYKVCVSG
jgi:hypothetical protein